MVPSVSFVGQSAFHIPAEAVAVNVDSSSTVSSGGTQDWHGRSYVVRRSSDGVLVMVYRTGTSHLSATSELHLRFSDDDGATWTAADTRLGGGAVSGFPMTPSTGEINAGEGMILEAPSGRLIMLLWRVDGDDWPSDQKGTEQSVSTDGGYTWSAPAAISMTGFADLEHTYVTDDWFVYDGVIYTCARIYDLDNPTDAYAALVKSTDDGATWVKVSNITAPGSDTNEVGLEYVGNSCIVALVGSFNNDETIQAISTNMGTSWTTTDVTATAASVTRRHKLYTRAHLKGQENWWNDSVLVCSGFENQNPGSSQSRRNMVLIGFWNAGTQTVAWNSLHYVDSTSEDAGYGDIFYDATNDQYVTVNYQGTLLAASLKQYRLSIAGI
jgi:hypothetical protein